MEFRQSRRVIPTGSTERHAPVERRGVRDLRKPRGDNLIAAVHRLDASLDQATRNHLVQWIQSEYLNEIGDMPLGFVAVCGLGPPYVDHILDLGHNIVHHYAPTDPMPEPFASARMLARSGAYAYVEVYLSGDVVPVLADGSVVA